MGEVVQLKDFQKTQNQPAGELTDSLVPIEFAVGFKNITMQPL